jgi:hypothetical protein
VAIKNSQQIARNHVGHITRNRVASDALSLATQVQIRPCWASKPLRTAGRLFRLWTADTRWECGVAREEERAVRAGVRELVRQVDKRRRKGPTGDGNYFGGAAKRGVGAICYPRGVLGGAKDGCDLRLEFTRVLSGAEEWRSGAKSRSRVISRWLPDVLDVVRTDEARS